MPQIPRYDGFTSGQGAGASISLGEAAAPGQALAGAGRRASATANEFLRAKVEATRAAEMADRLSTSIQAFEDWDVEQDPYDEQGKPRFGKLTEESDKAWGDINRKALEDVSDPVTAERLTLRMQDYYTRRRINVTAKAHSWEIDHRTGQLQKSLYKFADLASRAGSYDTVERYIADANAAIEGAVASQLMSPQQGEQAMQKFNQDMMSNYVRTQIYSGNMGEAAATLRNMRNADPGSALSSPEYFTLLKEMVSERARMEELELKNHNRAVQVMSVDVLARANAGEPTLAEVDTMAQRGVFTSLSQYTAVRNAVLASAAGDDDPGAVKWFMTKYAMGEATIEDLAMVRPMTSQSTFQGLAGMMHNSLDRKDLFNAKEYKESITHLEDRLRVTGRLAQRTTYVENVLIPQAKRELTLWAQANWDGKLDYATVLEFTEQLVARYEQVIPGRDNYTVRHAPPPRFKAPDEVSQAYEAGEFGEVGSPQAQSYMAEELRAIKLWEKRKAYERNKPERSAPDAGSLFN